MKSPILDILNEWRYVNLADVNEQYAIRNKILELGISGLVDVQFKEEPSAFRVTPVFATEKDQMWYNLKYDNSL